MTRQFCTYYEDILQKSTINILEYYLIKFSVLSGVTGIPRFDLIDL